MTEPMNAQTDRCRRCGDGFPAAVDPGDFDGICPACLAGLATMEDIAPSTLDPVSAAAKEPPPLKRGATFRGLEVLELVGQGGMGVVYKARQIELGRIVALKILSPRLAADPEFARRFTREAQALASLDHPNIVRVHDVGREGDLCFLVMEFVDGATLRDLLVQRRLPADQALRLVPQLCEALEYAHSRGVIHRDIKPENILVSRAGVAKVADFGLAKIVPGADAVAVSSLTQTNVVMGTVNYMAPEQREGRKEADHRADIYSLGVVFYELLTGELPVGRFDLPSRRTAVDARLDEVVLRALEKDPGRRYQRASELGKDVERLAGAAPPPAPDRPILDLVSNRRLGAAPGGRFSVRTVGCTVVAKGWDRPEIGVRVDGDYQFDGEASIPRLQSQVETRSVHVYLPAGSDLDLTVDEGDAQVADVRGHASVRIADGTLRVNAHDGPLRIQAGQGAVVVDALRSEYFEIRSRSGSVTLHDLALARGRGQVETEGGAVDLTASPTSSFRYYLEARTGTIEGAPSGQVGSGEGWLTVRTAAGSIRFTPPEPAALHWQEFVRRLTPAQIEKIGVFAIVNAGLFLFFGLVAGTVAPAVIVAVFWGMALGLELWKGYIRGTPGRSLTETVPGLLRKAMDLVPTPERTKVLDSIVPPKPETSALAVLSLVAAVPAFLLAGGAVIATVVERSEALRAASGLAADARFGAFGMGLAAAVLGIFALALGYAAGGHVAEGRGALRGRGLGHAAEFLSILGLVALAFLVQPRLADHQRSADGMRHTVDRFFDAVQAGQPRQARSFLARGLQEQVTDAQLAALRGALMKGPNGSASMQWYRMELPRRDREAVAVGTLWTSRGTTYVNVPLTLENGGWFIAGLGDLKRYLGDR
jgi:predicted Ser/Thr protein kinase